MSGEETWTGCESVAGHTRTPDDPWDPRKWGGARKRRRPEVEKGKERRDGGHGTRGQLGVELPGLNSALQIQTDRPASQDDYQIETSPSYFILDPPTARSMAGVSCCHTDWIDSGRSAGVAPAVYIVYVVIADVLSRQAENAKKTLSRVVV